jgi:hypothetical protein
VIFPESIRINAQFPFPTLVTSSGPVTITKQNGIWSVGLNTTNLAAVSAGAPPANLQLMAYNTSTQTYQQVSAAALLGPATINVSTYGAVGDGVHDDTFAIQSAINYAGNLGGGTVQLGAGRYLINSATLTIPQGVFLEGFWENLGERNNVDYSQLPCVLLLNPAYTIQITGRSAGLKGVAIINSTITRPITMRNALDGVNSFSGTAVTVGSPSIKAWDFYLGHLLIMGFAQGISCTGAQARPRVEFVAMDCTAGYFSDGAPDVGSISHVRCWPYYSVDVPASTFAVSNAANNGSGLIRITCAANTFITGDVVVINGVTGTTEANGRWTVTVINNTTLDLQGSTFTHAYVSGGTVYARQYARNGAAFDFQGNGGGFNAFVDLGSLGYDIGIKIEGGDDYDNLIGCWCDNNLAANDPTTIGVWILNSSAICISNHTFSSQGTSLKIDVSGRSVNRAFISNSRIFGTSTYTAQIVNGSAQFTNCTFGSAPIRTESTGGQSTLVNCDLSLATFSYGSQSTPRVNIVGCITAGNVGQFQPTGQTDQASTVMAKWNGPGRGTAAAGDNITQSYAMMNSAGNMVEVQRDHHRINTVTAGAESGEYYLSLVNGGSLADCYSWTPSSFVPLSSLNPALGGAGANRWGNVFCAGVFGSGNLAAQVTSAMWAGGSTGNGILITTTANFGIFCGSGAPTLSAAQGSLYLRSDGSSTSTRLYVNTNGSTTWTNVTTAT